MAKTEHEGLDKLKQVLCKAAVDSLYTTWMCSANSYAGRAVVQQTHDKGTERRIAFARRIGVNLSK